MEIIKAKGKIPYPKCFNTLCFHWRISLHPLEYLAYFMWDSKTKSVTTQIISLDGENHNKNDACIFQYIKKPKE